MKLSEKDVRYVAALAHLELTEDETLRMAHDLSGILDHVDKLNEVDTAGVQPMAQVLFDAGESATLSEDIEGPTLDNATALANSALSGSGHFKIPKVIER